MLLHHGAENSPPPGLLTEVFKKKIKTILPSIGKTERGFQRPEFFAFLALSRGKISSMVGTA